MTAQSPTNGPSARLTFDEAEEVVAVVVKAVLDTTEDLPDDLEAGIVEGLNALRSAGYAVVRIDRLTPADRGASWGATGWLQ